MDNKHDHQYEPSLPFWVGIAVVIVLGLVLMIVGSKQQPLEQADDHTESVGSETEPAIDEQPISTSDDLEKILNELDKTDFTPFEADLNQNDRDAEAL